MLPAVAKGASQASNGYPEQGWIINVNRAETAPEYFPSKQFSMRR
jgi:hypothetical protein